MTIGTPDSWDPTISFSSKDDYEICAWSPCGQFIAARTKKTVEIRNHLTFELLAVLQTAKYTSPNPRYFLQNTSSLTYSPDGRSLACGFPSLIVIWDIQTGGVAREIGYHSEVDTLVWSLDGRKIAAASDDYGGVSIATYDVASGARLSAKEFGDGSLHQLWAHKESFLLMIWANSETSIFDAGHAYAKTCSLRVGDKDIRRRGQALVSPSTGRVFALIGDTNVIVDMGGSHFLFKEPDNYIFPRVSPDGSFFAASYPHGFRVWKYASGSYILWGDYLFQDLFPHLPTLDVINYTLQFSPTSSSILYFHRNVIKVQRLQDPLTSPKTCRQHTAISRSGRHIATARTSESTVTIIGLHSQSPSQFIDTGVEIEGLAITGNILLVAGPGKVVGWLLTEEGTVEGVFSHKRASHSDSIWTTSSPFRRPQLLCFRLGFGGKVGVIGTEEIFPFVYDTETGGTLDLVHEPQQFTRRWTSFYQRYDGREYYCFRYPDTPPDTTPPEDGWLISGSAIQEAGWVVGPEGRHMFWVPVEWRTSWDRKNWHHDITTLFVRIGDQPVIIKF